MRLNYPPFGRRRRARAQPNFWVIASFELEVGWSVERATPVPCKPPLGPTCMRLRTGTDGGAGGGIILLPADMRPHLHMHACITLLTFRLPLGGSLSAVKMWGGLQNACLTHAMSHFLISRLLIRVIRCLCITKFFLWSFPYALSARVMFQSGRFARPSAIGPKPSSFTARIHSRPDRLCSVRRKTHAHAQTAGKIAALKAFKRRHCHAGMPGK
jgi:hypothetical protein